MIGTIQIKIILRIRRVYELFQEQVDKNPDSVALVFEDQELTYKQLDERSNQLARYLRSNYDIKPDTLITLCLDRSLEMVIGILGVMKSGGAYVPIDPNYPKERTSIFVILFSSESISLLDNACVSVVPTISPVGKFLPIFITFIIADCDAVSITIKYFTPT